MKNSTEQSHSISFNSHKRYKLCNRDFTVEVGSEIIVVNENTKLLPYLNVLKFV